MISAACRCVLLALAFASASAAAEAPARTAPSRPGPVAAGKPVPTRKLNRLDYVNVADVASRLGLQLTWIKRGEKLTLTGPGVKAELETGTRDVTINGLRVFLGDPVADSRWSLYVSKIDFERCLAPMLRPGYGAALPPGPRTIVLDPGHGGRDNGTSVNEKKFALDVAQRAKAVLEKAGLRVVLTRDKDIFLDLAERSAAANANRGDVFVSIHFNALENNAKVAGFEIYTFPPAGQHGAGWWSSMKKQDAYFMTTDEPGNRFDHWNVVLSHAIHRRFVNDLKVFDRGKKLMHLGVLRGLNCPGVLIECGFLTNEAEARKIATAEYRQTLAETLAAGIRDYAATVERVRPKQTAK